MKAYYFIFCLLLLSIGCQDNVTNPTEDSTFGIYLLKNRTLNIQDIQNFNINELELESTPWLASTDIDFYDYSSHCIYLKKDYKSTGQKPTTRTSSTGLKQLHFFANLIGFMSVTVPKRNTTSFVTKWLRVGLSSVLMKKNVRTVFSADRIRKMWQEWKAAPSSVLSTKLTPVPPTTGCIHMK